MSTYAISVSSSTSVDSWPDTSIGGLANRLKGLIYNDAEDDRSVAFGSRQWELDSAFADASASNWDGFGAAPVTLDTYDVATKFLSLVPRHAPDPDIAIDPDGEALFRWARGPREVLSVAVRGDGRLTFAAIFGDRELHGTERFSGEQIPEDVAGKMDRLFASWT